MSKFVCDFSALYAADPETYDVLMGHIKNGDLFMTHLKFFLDGKKCEVPSLAEEDLYDEYIERLMSVGRVISVLDPNFIRPDGDLIFIAPATLIGKREREVAVGKMIGKGFRMLNTGLISTAYSKIVSEILEEKKSRHTKLSIDEVYNNAIKICGRSPYRQLLYVPKIRKVCSGGMVSVIGLDSSFLDRVRSLLKTSPDAFVDLDRKTGRAYTIFESSAKNDILKVVEDYLDSLFYYGNIKLYSGTRDSWIVRALGREKWQKLDAFTLTALGCQSVIIELS